MSHVAKTPFDLTLHLVSVGGNSDGGWIPGNGFPNSQVGRIGQRYVDVQTGHIYGPKTRDGWSSEYTHTLNLGNVAGEFANMLSRVPALEVRATNLESRATVLERRADSAADLAIQHHVTLQDHGLRIETLEADSLEVRRRLGIVDGTLGARMLAVEDALNDLSRLRNLDIADFNSRLNTVTSELNGNSSTLTKLQESYTSMTQTWAQEITTLRSEFAGNIATLQETLRTHATRYTANAELITELTARVGANAAAITTESHTRADAFSSLAQQISQLSAKTSTTTANLTTQQTAMANELEAYASSVLAMDVKIDSNAASFQEEIETLAAADESLARRVSTLDVASADLQGRITNEESARISGDSAVLTAAQQLVATSEAGTQVKIAEEAAARLAGDQAEAYQRSLLDTKFSNQEQALQAAINAESTARSNAIEAETQVRNQQIATLNTTIGNLTNFANGLGTRINQVSAAITAESKTRADAIAAETSSRNQQISTLNTNISNVSAAVTQEASTRANAIAAETSSRNKQIATLNTNIGNVSVAVTQEASTRASVDGYLGGRYTLNVTTSGGGMTSVAGMEIAGTRTSDRQTTNHIAFYADRFYITHSNSSASAVPFEVVGGRVYIKSAVIQDASITNAKIANAAIDSAKIQNAAITNAKISNLSVDTLKIAGNSVTVSVGATGTTSIPTINLYLPYGGKILVIISIHGYADLISGSSDAIALRTRCNGLFGPFIILRPHVLWFGEGSGYGSYSGMAMGLFDGIAGSNSVTGHVNVNLSDASYTLLALGMQR